MIPSRQPRKRRRKPYGKPRYPHKRAKVRPPAPPGLMNIVYLRHKMGWRQVDLAKHSGVNLETIYSLEQGKTIDPKLSTLLKLAKALRVTLGVLVGVENPLE